MATLTSRRAAYAASGRPGSLIGRAFALLGLHNSRRSLAQLDASLLDDIGVTREQAMRESRRKIWDVPSNWRG
ncbi:DUF1127 domain-containing protein [Pseudooceanicola sp. LIPI14-2-Ac024]|uniref:DUF1127 domain-containing protein n=1 Tax=Pseudooceanicola sp. LIPI14-2-Ac024 TaxID=3344875 RepID=UPI0035CFC3D2